MLRNKPTVCIPFCRFSTDLYFGAYAHELHQLSSLKLHTHCQKHANAHMHFVIWNHMVTIRYRFSYIQSKTNIFISKPKSEVWNDVYLVKKITATCIYFFIGLTNINMIFTIVSKLLENYFIHRLTLCS